MNKTGGDEVTNTPEHPDDWQADDIVPTEQLALRQRVKTITSVAEQAQPHLSESDGHVWAWPSEVAGLRLHPAFREAWDAPDGALRAVVTATG